MVCQSSCCAVRSYDVFLLHDSKFWVQAAADARRRPSRQKNNAEKLLRALPDSNLRKNGSEIDRPVRQVQLKPTSLKVAVEKLATFSATATKNEVTTQWLCDQVQNGKNESQVCVCSAVDAFQKIVQVDGHDGPGHQQRLLRLPDVFAQAGSRSSRQTSPHVRRLSKDQPRVRVHRDSGSQDRDASDGLAGSQERDQVDDS